MTLTSSTRRSKPAKPGLKKAATTASSKAQGLPAKNKQDIALPPAPSYAPTVRRNTSDTPRPVGLPAKPANMNRRTSEVVADTDGVQRYLKDRDMALLRFIAENPYPTTRHCNEAVGSTMNYLPRRMKQLAGLSLIEKMEDSLGHPVWKVLPRGMAYLGPTVPVVNLKPYTLDHTHNEVVNTVAVKLGVGVDEPILHEKSAGYVNEPLPIISSAWMRSSAEFQKKRDITPRMVEDEQLRLINEKTHPKEDRVGADIRKGVLPAERTALEHLYKKQDSAYLFNSYDENGKPEHIVDLVVLRPLVAERRADGRLSDEVDFNHDAIRVEDKVQSDEYYRYVLNSIFHNGMYGRLFCLTDLSPSASNFIPNALRDAWAWLIRNEFVPRYAEPFLIIRDLPEPLNNTGKGLDAYDEAGLRRARTRFDG